MYGSSHYAPLGIKFPTHSVQTVAELQSSQLGITWQERHCMRSSSQ